MEDRQTHGRAKRRREMDATDAKTRRPQTSRPIRPARHFHPARCLRKPHRPQGQGTSPPSSASRARSPITSSTRSTPPESFARTRTTDTSSVSRPWPLPKASTASWLRRNTSPCAYARSSPTPEKPPTPAVGSMATSSPCPPLRGQSPVGAAQIPVGFSGHAHARAAGKLLLALADPELAESYLNNHPREARTSKTITDRDQLLEQFKLIREKGYSMDDEEFHEGICCLAVPIEGLGGRFVLGISVPSRPLRGQLRPVPRRPPQRRPHQLLNPNQEISTGAQPPRSPGRPPGFVLAFAVRLVIPEENLLSPCLKARHNPKKNNYVTRV